MINTQSKCLSFIVELLKKSRIKNLNGHFDSNKILFHNELVDIDY
jgi:hypothetical protein